MRRYCGIVMYGGGVGGLYGDVLRVTRGGKLFFFFAFCCIMYLYVGLGRYKDNPVFCVFVTERYVCSKLSIFQYIHTQSIYGERLSIQRESDLLK